MTNIKKFYIQFGIITAIIVANWLLGLSIFYDYDILFFPSLFYAIPATLIPLVVVALYFLRRKKDDFAIINKVLKISIIVSIIYFGISFLFSFGFVAWEEFSCGPSFSLGACILGNLKFYTSLNYFKTYFLDDLVLFAPSWVYLAFIILMGWVLKLNRLKT